MGKAAPTLSTYHDEIGVRFQRRCPNLAPGRALTQHLVDRDAGAARPIDRAVERFASGHLDSPEDVSGQSSSLMGGLGYVKRWRN